MSFTYDPSTDAGRVRLLCTDTVEAYAIFQDNEIDAFLVVENDNVLYAAAIALDTIASSTALIDKKIKTGDLQTDGPAVANTLMARAATLRERADNEVDFDFAEFATSPRVATQLVWNSALRSGL